MIIFLWMKKKSNYQLCHNLPHFWCHNFAKCWFVARVKAPPHPANATQVNLLAKACQNCGTRFVCRTFGAATTSVGVVQTGPICSGPLAEPGGYQGRAATKTVKNLYIKTLINISMHIFCSFLLSSYHNVMIFLLRILITYVKALKRLLRHTLM
jgi:hypothetical protein